MPSTEEVPAPAADETHASVAHIMRDMSKETINGKHVGSEGGLQQLQAQAAAKAAQEIGLPHSMAMAAMPSLLNANVKEDVEDDDGGKTPSDIASPSPTGCRDENYEGVQPVGVSQSGEQCFTCTVCRKVFKREMNLIFHMTTHRPRQPQSENAEAAVCQPVKCHECDKEFATKYQAKKHFLRRHFQGDKPFSCPKCLKKRFVVKEDLTMHMKSCGNVYVCTCGIRLCSLGALKRHCKYFSHEPESLEPQPDPSAERLSLEPPHYGAATNWAAEAEEARRLAGLHQLCGLSANGACAPQPPAHMGAHGNALSASELLLKLHPNAHAPHAMDPAYAYAHAVQQHAQQQHAQQQHAPPPAAGAQGAPHPGRGPTGDGAQAPTSAAALVWSMMGGAGGRDSRGAQSQWTPEVLSGMMPSLAHALRQAQGSGLSAMDLSNAARMQQHADPIMHR